MLCVHYSLKRKNNEGLLVTNSPIDPFASATLQDPYPFFRWMRENSPVYKVPETGHYMVASRGAIEEVCAHPEHYSSRMSTVLRRSDEGQIQLVDMGISTPESGIVLGAEDGDVHRRHRRILSRCFTPAVRKLRPLIEKAAQSAIAELQKHHRVELIQSYAKKLPQQVVMSLIDIPEADLDILDKATTAAIKVIGGVNTDEELMVDGTHLMVLQEYLDAHLTRCEKHTQSSVMKGLVAAIATSSQSSEDTLTREEVCGVLYQLVIGGSETTVSLIGSALKLISENTELYQTLHHSPSLIPAFLEETLRFESPAQGNYRRSIADTQLAGVDIPAGSTLTLLWGSANRDASIFDHADQFDIHRPNVKNHIAFGKGVHFCVGASLARLEAQIAVEQWLQADCRSTLYEQLPVYHPSLFVRCLESLPVIIRQ